MPTARPYEAVPPEAADVLRPVLPGLADETIAAIAREVPDYARAMEGDFGQVVRLGVEVAFNRFLDLLAAAQPRAGRETARTYIDLGRGEFHAGRSLDALLAAYRVGARLAWRRFVEAGRRRRARRRGDLRARRGDLRLHRRALRGVGRGLRRGAERRRRRERAAAAAARAALAQEPPASQESIRTAAAAAGWTLPRGGVAALVAATAEDGEQGEALLDSIAARFARRLGEGAIGAEAAGAALVDDPRPGRTGLPAAARGRGRRPRGRARPDRAVARGRGERPRAPAARTGSRSPAGSAAHANLLVADDHLADLLLAAAPDVAADLAASRLAPLAELAPGPRARLEETLAAWLDRPGQVQAVAAALGVHPQTVRYRVRQLRDLFGERLEDPDARFELALALRARG